MHSDLDLNRRVETAQSFNIGLHLWLPVTVVKNMSVASSGIRTID